MRLRALPLKPTLLHNVVVRADILPRDFLQALGNYYLSLTMAKIGRLKKFHGQKLSSISKGFDHEIINFHA